MPHEAIDDWLETSAHLAKDHLLAQESQEQDILDHLVIENAVTPLEGMHIERAKHAVRHWQESTEASDQEAVELFNYWLRGYLYGNRQDT